MSRGRSGERGGGLVKRLRRPKGDGLLLSRWSASTPWLECGNGAMMSSTGAR